MTRPNWLTPPYEPPSVSLGGLATLTNVGASYDAVNVSRGLGIVEIDFTNVSRIDWGVFVNKVGTGTQDWQLWNLTDSAELGVLSDSGATGAKELTGAITSGIPTGIKRVRIRARSSVATDDPVYYGGWVRCS